MNKKLTNEERMIIEMALETYRATGEDYLASHKQEPHIKKLIERMRKEIKALTVKVWKL